MMKDCTTRVLHLLIVMNFLLQGIESMHSENMMQVGSDAWMYCHGLPKSVYMKICSCMVEYKEMLAEKYGIDAKTKFTHSTIVGDVIFTQAECENNLWLLDNEQQGNQANHTKKRKKRKFFEQPRTQKWDFPIKYIFHEDITVEDRKMINGAMQHWGDRTCVRFEPFDADKHGAYSDRILFTNKPDGCYSYIGRQDSTVMPQQINLQTNGCTGWIGVVVHEIGHALGLFHEQNRLDREFWVRFYPNNVNPEVISNFDLEMESKSYDVPYDYGSVMQYDNRAFSALGGIVLEAILPYSEYTMGQRGHLSYLDAKIMNKGYCSSTCNDFPILRCLNGGYRDPNDCTICRCPEGFGGQICETAAPSDEGCSPTEPVLEASHQIQCLKSPGFDDPRFYPLPSKCNWIIQAPAGATIRARFDGEFGVYCSGSAKRGPMCFHWVEVKHKKNKEIRGGRFCCYDKTQFIWNEPGVIVSESNVMVVHFDATWPQTTNAYTATPSVEARRGFRLCYALNSDSVIWGNQTDEVDVDVDETEWWGSKENIPVGCAPRITITIITTVIIYTALAVTTFLGV